MDKQYLNDEFNRFFDFPTEDKSQVSSVSAKLFAEHIAYPLERELEKLQAERDKATQYWQIAEGRCDALMKQRDDLLSVLKIALKQLEEWEVKIDSEFGDCRQLNAIDAAGDLSEATVAVRSAIASVKEN